MCILAREGGSYAAWLADALTRIQSSDSTSALVSALCALVHDHVHQKFILDPHVRVALALPAAVGGGGIGSVSAPSTAQRQQALLLWPQSPHTSRGPGRAADLPGREAAVATAAAARAAETLSTAAGLRGVKSAPAPAASTSAPVPATNGCVIGFGLPAGAAPPVAGGYHDVHSPSGDLCMLMRMRKAEKERGAGAGPAFSAESLALLVLPLADGAALALYLGFTRRLPGELLRAVQTSGQLLLNQALGPLLRAKLTGLAEYHTLCSAGPGSYAVLRSTSFTSTTEPGGLQLATASNSGPSTANALEALSALGLGVGCHCLSNAHHSAHSRSLTATGAQATQQLSGVLSTSDIEEFMAPLTAVQARLEASPPPQVDGVARLGAHKRGGPRTPTRLKWRPGSASSRPSSPFPSALRTRGGATGPTPRAAPWRGLASLLALNGSRGGGGGNGQPSRDVTFESYNVNMLLQSAPNETIRDVAARAATAAAAPTGLHRIGSTGDLAFRPAVRRVIQPSALITVSRDDEEESAAGRQRQQLDLLMSSIGATIGADRWVGGDCASPAEDLDSLLLCEELGRGAGGTVFRAKQGTLEVAVKLMQLPVADSSPDDAAQPAPPALQPLAAKANNGAAGGAAIAAVAATDAKALTLNTRRELLRNATELAVLSRLSHPNIVQMYGVYKNVQLVAASSGPGAQPAYSLRPAPAGEELTTAPDGPGAETAGDGGSISSKACIAAVFELCDQGSLLGALASRQFPRSSSRLEVIMQVGRSVYLTLLDLALALRHLHASGLLHRDIKPANLLLRSAPRDPRGFTVKLADFGFVTRLDQTADDGSRYTLPDQACGTVTHMPPEAFSPSIVMWEMFAVGVRPFTHLPASAIPRAVHRGARPVFSAGVPLMYRGLAAACWSQEPSRRPRAADLVQIIRHQMREMALP
ncbi:hypothetical protein GPECTOR_21g629 [Gonium pectorale]|uniref:Protein kinase domain-containing protein n=1 Tax=Gonium pectorale TaxID=33097 RepID=A0A150GHY5_GONPE|nr:hypothetical protein GPECTOR_21g629 [Gonium pectorale]|eukprot:KXZ49403.1 hypothetical protein GPECTOR_21g629 [Gonium pectorale]